MTEFLIMFLFSRSLPAPQDPIEPCRAMFWATSGQLRLSPDNFNLFGLAESVAAVLGLLVIVRIEIQIMKDHAVGCSQVDPETTWVRQEASG